MLGAILAAAAPAVISGFGQSETNRHSARDAARNRQFNADEAQKARDFTAEQSATEVQRRVQDLKAAGLNPALAYGNPAASNPGAATASSSSMPTRNSAAGAGMQSAMQILQFARQVQQLGIEKRLAEAEVLKKGAETADILATRSPRIESMNARSANERQQHWHNALLYNLREGLISAQTRQAHASASQAEEGSREIHRRSDRDEEAFRSGFGRYAPFINSGTSLIADMWRKYVGGIGLIGAPVRAGRERRDRNSGSGW